MLSAIQKQVSASAEQKAQGLWVPNWKIPVNWLTGQCWEDEMTPITFQERKYAKYKTYSKKKSPADIIWESCKEGLNFDFDFEDEPEPTSTTDNVIKLENYREEV